MDVATWNVLHDGRLIAAAGSVPGDVKLSIEIEYLCRHLPTQSRHLFVRLNGCERLEFQPYEQPPISKLAVITAFGLELLSAEIAGEFMNIDCADGSYGGNLLLRYVSAELSTAEGQPLSQSDVESAAERYWSEWQKRHVKRS